VKSEKLNKIGLALTAAAISAADQLSKQLALKLDLAHFPWPGVIEFTDHRNYGLVANLPVPLAVILAITLAVSALIGHRLFFAKPHDSSNGNLALAIVLGGAIGNLADRLRLGYVHDWAMFFGTSIVNLADAAIAFGLLWYAFLLWKKPDEQG